MRGFEGRFDGKVVVVTGGSRGIGRAAVERFAAEGARVWFTWRRHAEEAEALAAATGARAVSCDQSDPAAVEAAATAILQAEGRVDVLVNNAGITSDAFFAMMTPEQWHKVLDTNLHGVFHWCRAVARPMLGARDGAIINVASVSGLVGVPGQANYAASKGALLAFTRTLAAELGSRGVRVNAVVPGFIDTDMTARMPRDIKRQNQKAIVLGRFGRTEEIAAAIAFLASPEASYVVGQVLVVDGGLTSTGMTLPS